MKISKKRIDILIIFVIFILIETISIASYQSAVYEETEEINKKLANRLTMEKEEVVLNKEEEKALYLINEFRQANGLDELKVVFKLQEVARKKAEDIVNNEYFSHTSPNLGTPFNMLQSNGIDYKIAGENLAGNTTVPRAIRAWINSKSHRENILEEQYEYTGICVIESEKYGRVFVQLFMGI